MTLTLVWSEDSEKHFQEGKAILGCLPIILKPFGEKPFMVSLVWELKPLGLTYNKNPKPLTREI